MFTMLGVNDIEYTKHTHTHTHADANTNTEEVSNIKVLFLVGGKKGVGVVFLEGKEKMA